MAMTSQSPVTSFGRDPLMGKSHQVSPHNLATPRDQKRTTPFTSSKPDALKETTRAGTTSDGLTGQDALLQDTQYSVDDGKSKTIEGNPAILNSNLAKILADNPHQTEF